MAMQDDAIDVFEKLIETCRDGQVGYRDAAELVKNPELRATFQQKSAERGQFATELENYVQRLGKRDPQRSGSVAGAIHRSWFELKEKLGGSDASLLEEVERGEDEAKKAYEEVLRKDLPTGVRTIVEQQAQIIFADHDRARMLRDQFKSAA